MATLVIFCKRPLPGQGKQRIAATLGTESAYQVALALLECALEDARAWNGTVVLSPASEADRSWAESLLQREHLVVPQVEGNLGEKLNFVDRALRQQGHTQLLFIGTDAPEHNHHYYRELQDQFSHADMVFTPASDGGVTAMGCNQPWPDLAALPWSTDKLGETLAKSCIDAGYPVAYSRECSDVDTETDLRRLLSSLQNETRPARQQLLHTIKSLLD